jgi:hypothetical protein
MIEPPMTTYEFCFRVFSYRLDVYFAAQRYALEVQALEQLKVAYDGHVPQVIWEKQRRRVQRARMQLAVRRSILTVFLADLRN